MSMDQATNINAKALKYEDFYRLRALLGVTRNKFKEGC